MRIFGFQKLTLLDYPGKTACTLFTGGCNFRCPFCHNSSLVLDPEQNGTFPEEEILAFLEKRKNLLDGVAVTGGEPLLENDIGEFLQKIRSLGYSVKLDTNGYLPDRLESLLQSGLVDYVAMDIKNSPDRYAETAGVPKLDFSRIQRSISLLMNSGIEYEFRTTVVKELHRAEDFLAISQLISGCKRYFIQSFIDSGDILAPGMTVPSHEELCIFLEIMRKNGIPVQARGFTE